ncbi:hypothetical protein LXL04_034603 [Taraxacum kok-saghyz]
MNTGIGRLTCPRLMVVTLMGGFFRLKVDDEEKIEAAVLSLSGDALAWFRWSDKQRPVATWEQMKTLFIKKFRSTVGGDIYEQWSALEQTGSTTGYIRKFIELAAPLEDVSERVALASFVKGLKATAVLWIWPSRLKKKNRSLRSSGFGTLGFRNLGQNRPTSGTFPTNSTPNPPATRINEAIRLRPREDLRLTEAQIKDRRARGLCFKCNEKWNRGHHCKTQFNVILIEDPEESEEEEVEEEILMEQPTTLDSTKVGGVVEISLTSVAELSSPKTMKLRGQVLGQPVVALVDPGATHNFIARDLW